MKKVFLFICLSMLLISGLQAQQTLYSSTGYTADTVTNTGSKTLTIANAIPNFRKTATACITIVKISGTGAGTAQLQGSIDGTNWYNVGSAYTITDVASQSAFIKQTDYGDLYTRYLVTGSGTESIRISAKFLTKQ